MLRKFFWGLAALAFSVTAFAQRPAQVSSPIVNPDNTVTFNLSAPNAKNVKISAQFAPKADMVRNENGVWTITLGPVEPDIYPYCFEVDGVAVMCVHPEVGRTDRRSGNEAFAKVVGRAAVHGPHLADAPLHRFHVVVRQNVHRALALPGR